MKNKLLFYFIFSLIMIGTKAQSMGSNYNTALGVKFWDGAGISFKTFLVPKNALELIGYFNRFGTRITVLYEIHESIEVARGLKWYIGPGAHIGFYNYRGYYGDKTVAGIDGVTGFDYKVKKTPLNFSVDWQPSFEFEDSRGFNGSWGGVGARYTF